MEKTNSAGEMPISIRNVVVASVVGTTIERLNFFEDRERWIFAERRGRL